MDPFDSGLVEWIFFFGNMSTQEGGEEIRTSDFRFIRRNLQPIKIPIRDESSGYLYIKHQMWIIYTSNI
jgi:hypothetical protein